MPPRRPVPAAGKGAAACLALLPALALAQVTRTTEYLSRMDTDGDGRVQEVRGAGVVGQQPHLDPGQSHTYSSGTVLATQVGNMHGSYQMLADDGTRFEAPIAPFRLAVPGALH